MLKLEVSLLLIKNTKVMNASNHKNNGKFALNRKVRAVSTSLCFLSATLSCSDYVDRKSTAWFHSEPSNLWTQEYWILQVRHVENHKFLRKLFSTIFTYLTTYKNWKLFIQTYDINHLITMQTIKNSRMWVNQSLMS